MKRHLENLLLMLTAFALIALLCGCVAVREVRVTDGRRQVWAREESYVFVPGEWSAAIGPTTATLSTQKRTLESLGSAAIGAAAGWLAAGGL